jgi:hypothetical protein
MRACRTAPSGLLLWTSLDSATLSSADCCFGRSVNAEVARCPTRAAVVVQVGRELTATNALRYRPRPAVSSAEGCIAALRWYWLPARERVAGIYAEDDPAA